MKKKKTSRSNKIVWAEFIGYQKGIEEGAIPLFNIHGNHSQSGSTVDANAVVREGIPVMAVIAPSAWSDEMDLKS